MTTPADHSVDQPESHLPTVSPSVALITMLATIWRRIQRHHPEVPSVVVLAAPSSDRKHRVLGHFAPLRWRPNADTAARYHEVVIVAEHLNRSAEDITETLLHEAAHALNNARGIHDCSATSQYHNSAFKAAAEELGLVVKKVPNYGWAYTQLSATTLDPYRDLVADLASVLIHRRLPGDPALVPPPSDRASDPSTGGDEPPAHADDETTSRSRLRKAICACDPPFIIRASRKVLDATEVLCSTCNEPFLGV